MSGLRDAVCFIVNKGLGKVPLVGDLLSMGGTALCGKQVKYERYRRLRGIALELIRVNGRDSKEAADCLDELASLAEFGARRRHFRRLYVDRQSGYKDLPDNPDNLPYAARITGF